MSGCNDKCRMMSHSSFSSSDSSCLDPSEGPYAIIDVSDQNLLPCKTNASSGKGEKSSSCRCSLAVVSLVVSVVCLATLVGSLVMFFHFVYSPDVFFGRSSEEERVCIPCAHIAANPLEESQLPFPREMDIQRGDDGDTEICCASSPSQYAKLFKLILRRQEEVKKFADLMANYSDHNNDGGDSDAISHRAVSAHLLAKQGKPGQTLQSWKSPKESPVSHLRGSLHFYNNNTLLVHTEGLYFVYCQILFNPAPKSAQDPNTPADPSSSTSSVLASHYVKRNSLLYPASSAILLKARHTRMSGQGDRHSSYVGGLFLLYAGDRLYVQVSVPELVSRDDRASFFGLFRVGT